MELGIFIHLVVLLYELISMILWLCFVEVPIKELKTLAVITVFTDEISEKINVTEIMFLFADSTVEMSVSIFPFAPGMDFKLINPAGNLYFIGNLHSKCIQYQ